MRFNPELILKKHSPRARDVKNVQYFLNVCMPDQAPLLCDGAFGEKTRQAVHLFQKRCDLLPTDCFGIREFCVGADKFAQALQNCPPNFLLTEGMGLTVAASLAHVFLRLEDLKAAAQDLAIDLPTLCAVFEVESAGRGFHFVREDKHYEFKPVILYERHVAFKRAHLYLNSSDIRTFSRLFPADFASKAGGYHGGLSEYARVQSLLNRHLPAPLVFESCSWGLFQIMGHHWQHLDFDSIDAFVEHQRTEQGQLQTFVRFIQKNNLQGFLKHQKWANFARRYNGPAYAKNQYDIRLARAFAFWESHLEDLG